MDDVFGSDAKVGDAVGILNQIRFRPGRVHLTRGVIERLTATQVVAMGGRRFSRRTGAEIGGGAWGKDWLEPLTQEMVDRHDESEVMNLAEIACSNAAHRLTRARGEDALRFAAMLPDELKAELR